SKLFRQVYTIEIVPELAKRAGSTLARMGYKNVYIKKGSGEWGWKEKAPFDAIIITAGVKKVPDELFEQLKVDGILVAPVGKGNDKVMTRFHKASERKAKLKKEAFGIFHFVPFVEKK
ncbi:protein-L-isoaspartate O-methyltransferase, partial [Patescibacteria group bacterium]